MTAKPRKMEQYLANAEPLAARVNAYRAERGEASAEAPFTQEPTRAGSNVTDSAPAPTKKKSYYLPPLDRPTPIEGYPFAEPDGEAKADVPDYHSMASLKASRARQAERLGKHAPIKPTGPSELRKAATFGNSARQPER